MADLENNSLNNKFSPVESFLSFSVWIDKKLDNITISIKNILKIIVIHCSSKEYDFDNTSIVATCDYEAYYIYLQFCLRHMQIFMLYWSLETLIILTHIYKKMCDKSGAKWREDLRFLCNTPLPAHKAL